MMMVKMVSSEIKLRTLVSRVSDKSMVWDASSGCRWTEPKICSTGPETADVLCFAFALIMTLGACSGPEMFEAGGPCGLREMPEVVASDAGCASGFEGTCKAAERPEDSERFPNSLKLWVSSLAFTLVDATARRVAAMPILQV
eukprot:CAMPEP_0115404066 /NCGR_PEP_ID=MMETSP0271-20121206/17221_1 /TAXON_ID=71861 /ORGANISM="Scrippsiella trochoidea, Strain CCMP3099" /LENGTH=142 /DNA_ID=CAMNT_0002828019 /DNA_START=229 /DNA_END=658 /DNA_ORIENTATION=+